MNHQNTSTQSFLSRRGEESRSISPVEWSPNCVFHRQQHQSSIVEVSPSPSISSSKTRRVSTASSGSSASCSGLSCISSSESSSSSSSSSSIGFRTHYDDTDGTTELTCIIGEDDPIISFEALSLETQRITLDVTTTPTRTGIILNTKTCILLEEEKYQQRKEEKLSSEVLRGMNPMQGQEPDRQEHIIETLNLASSFEEKDRFALSRRPHSILSLSGPKKGQHHPWNRNSLETIITVPRVVLSDDSSLRPVSFPPEEEQHQQQQRTTSKKYTIKKSTNAIRSASITEIEAPRELRTKRQRGGSDFTMASASSVGDATTNSTSSTTTSPLTRRKRRRINRNRAMAADDFDSILSQINATGSLQDN